MGHSPADFAREGGTGKPRLLVGYAEVCSQGTGKLALTRGTRAWALLAAVVLLAGSAPTALAQGNHVFAVGSNDFGQLGIGTAETWLPGPSLVNGVTAVGGGQSHSLARKDDGTVWAWGANFHGQLGDGTWTNWSTPVQVVGLTGVTAVAAGDWHSLALKGDGTAWAWGSNSYGQLGNWMAGNYRTIPIQIVELASMTAIAGGSEHSLAVRGDGTVWAWGRNYYGQLGDGTTIDRVGPVRATGLPTGATGVAAGWYHSLFLVSSVQGDLDGEGSVDASDFAIFLVAFGRSVGQPQFDARCDYDADGTVTLADYQVWLGYYRAFVGNPAADAPPMPPGDADSDGDVDLADFAAMQECAGGAPERALACLAIFDFDGNGQVDILDAAEFVAAMGGL
jgi:hypothetical protein